MYTCGSIMFKQILFFSLKVYVYIYSIMSLYKYIVNMLPGLLDDGSNSCKDICICRLNILMLCVTRESKEEGMKDAK